MQRRKYLAALGSLAAGGATLVGTGATDVIQANRSVSLDVAGDSSAYLTLDPNVSSTSEFVNQDSTTGVISFDFAGATNGASGANNDATTSARPAFTMKNASDTDMYAEVWNPFRNGNIDTQQKNTRGTASVTMPAGLDFQFIAVKKGNANSIGKQEYALIDREDGPETPDNYNPSAGSFGDVPSNAYIIRDPSRQQNFAGWAADLTKSEDIGHIKLEAGEAVDVIVRLVADGVDLSSANIPTSGPVYVEAASDQGQMTFPEATGATNLMS